MILIDSELFLGSLRSFLTLSFICLRCSIYRLLCGRCYGALRIFLWFRTWSRHHFLLFSSLRNEELKAKRRRRKLCNIWIYEWRNFGELSCRFHESSYRPDMIVSYQITCIYACTLIIASSILIGDMNCFIDS